MLLALLAGAVLAYVLFSSATIFGEPAKYLYVRSAKNARDTVLQQLEGQHLIKNQWAFNLAASQMHLWDKIKPGKFEIPKGQSILNLVRMLRNNRQSQVKLVINKVRTLQDLSRLVGRNFATDSITFYQFITTPDSLRSNKLTDPILADTNTFMAAVIPNTYQFYWTAPPATLVQKLYAAQQRFWETNNRKQKAEQHGLTPLQATTVASIVEEETNADDEKGNVASVYINRLNRNMPLQADPTIKFALRDFSIRRILYGHLEVASPYNTYRNTGLPPGPICTPSVKTIDAVLNSPSTDYIYFVASAEFNGHHHFSSNYAEHEQYAKQYQKALTELMERKAAKAQAAAGNTP